MLEGASLCCGSFPASAGGRASELALPPLPAVVIDFPQAHLDPAHDVVGMLGQDMLQQFDAGEQLGVADGRGSRPAADAHACTHAHTPQSLTQSHMRHAPHLHFAQTWTSPPGASACGRRAPWRPTRRRREA